MEDHLIKIGFFGGTFDPIHFGHIELAIWALETQGLDEVLFCPTSLSPFKADHLPHASAHHRLAMVKLAIESIPKMRVSDYEIGNQGPSYTVDTIRHLLKVNPANYHLILGEDALKGIGKWKEPDELLSLAPPLVGARALKISSTAVRERLKKRLYCGHLVPEKVLAYIYDNKLY